MVRRTLVVAALLLTACGGDDDDTADAAISPDAGATDAGAIDAAPTPDAMPPSVVECPDPVPAPADGACDVAATGDAAVLLRGDVLAPDVLYEDGAVLIDADGYIACVGCDCADSAGGATRIDCGGAVISPALINPHDHMTFSENAPADHGTTRYDHRHDWRGSISSPQNPHGTGGGSIGNQWVEIRQVMAGTVSMAGSGLGIRMVRNLDREGFHDLALRGGEQEFSRVNFQTFPLGDSDEFFRADCGWRYSDSEQEIAEEPAYLPHVAEGIDSYASEEFRCLSTSFDGGVDHTEANVAHIHSIGLTAADYYRMALDDAQIIWSPRSNIDLYGVTAQVTTFDRLGGTIALGTDWSLTGSINVGRELACADSYNRDYLDGYFTDRQLWKMVTVNAARVTGTTAYIGSLTVDKLGDVTVFDGGADPYRAVIDAGAADVALVLRAGEALYGETELVEGLGETCETLDVCGEPRAICAGRELGIPYATLAADSESVYPAFFCDTPPDEPSCVPARPGEYDGALTATDADGDGFADADDNCPAVFNPVRPIDGGAQPDADGDGVGDPCDPTPLPTDLDADGVLNTADNCPFDPNDLQTDGDTDGKGDICDFCPEVSNPVGVCPPPPPMTVAIEDIQNGTISVGTTVRLVDVVVTAVGGDSVVVQDPSPTAIAYSGIYVFTGGTPMVDIDDVVDIDGVVEEYFNNTEVASATITPKGSTMTIAPTDVTAAQAASEPYEGVLVRVTDFASFDSPWDCATDGSGCADANLWQANGPSDSLVVYDRFYTDADWATHIGDLTFSGVLMYRWNRRRIMPRTAADF